jgi:hypothetical protein
MDVMAAEMLASTAVNQNSLLVLPQSIQDKYWIEDCFLECEFTNESVQECKEWIINTVNEIESITDQKVENYPPVEINDKKKYFCFNLCGRPKCPYLLKYKYDNIDTYKKNKSQEKIASIVGNNQIINLDSLFK